MKKFILLVLLVLGILALWYRPSIVRAWDPEISITSSYICYNQQRILYTYPLVYSGNYRFRYDVKNISLVPRKVQAVFAGFDWDGQTMGMISEIFIVPAKSTMQKYKTVTLTSMYQQVGVCIAEPGVYMGFDWWFNSCLSSVLSKSPIGKCL